MFDVQNRKWSSEMLSAFEIDENILPKVYESIEVTGTVSESGASETGLKIGTPIIAGAGDNAAGAIGMGIVENGKVSATIGTSGVIFAVSDKPRIDLQGQNSHALSRDSESLAQYGRYFVGWTFVQMVSGKFWRMAKVTMNWSPKPKKFPAVQMARFGLPYLMGERAPHLDANARAAFVGITASHTKAHFTRAVLEGVAFSLRDSLEIFKEFGVEISSIRLGGGGAKSALWRQIQADVYRKPVEIIEGDEGAAFGAAIFAGVGAGHWKTVDEACEKTIRVVETIEPNANSVEKLNQNYEAYKLLYSALRRQ